MNPQMMQQMMDMMGMMNGGGGGGMGGGGMGGGGSTFGGGGSFGSDSKGQGRGRPNGKGVGKNGQSIAYDPCKVFVKGFPKEATADDITNYFTQFGAVKTIDLKTDKNTGQSRGFCFIVFEEQDVAKACCDYTPHLFCGETLVVKEAAGGKGEQSSAPAPAEPAPAPVSRTASRKIFAGGLPWEATADDMRAYFNQFGTVKMVDLKMGFDGRSKGYGFVEFDDAESANQALSYEPHEMGGKKIDVKTAQPGIGKGQPKGKGKGMMMMNPMMAMMQMMMQGGGGGGNDRYSPY